MVEKFNVRFNAKISEQQLERFKMLAEVETSGNTSVLFRQMIDKKWLSAKRQGLVPPKKEGKECDHLNG
jgi:hypothetical protein